jgi:hypothetical protein
MGARLTTAALVLATAAGAAQAITWRQGQGEGVQAAQGAQGAQGTEGARGARATPAERAREQARLAQQLLERAQARAELELLVAEAMWGPVARVAYQPVWVAIAVNGRQRLALLDPTGAKPPRWLNEPFERLPVQY